MEFSSGKGRELTGLPVIKVGMGEGVVAVSPHVIISEGIGSCVALTLYDLRLRIGGLAHVVLRVFRTVFRGQRSATGRMVIRAIGKEDKEI